MEVTSLLKLTEKVDELSQVARVIEHSCVLEIDFLDFEDGWVVALFFVPWMVIRDVNAPNLTAYSHKFVHYRLAYHIRNGHPFLNSLVLDDADLQVKIAIIIRPNKVIDKD